MILTGELRFERFSRDDLENLHRRELALASQLNLCCSLRIKLNLMPKKNPPPDHIAEELWDYVIEHRLKKTRDIQLRRLLAEYYGSQIGVIPLSRCDDLAELCLWED